MATAIQKITLSPSRDIPFNKLLLSQANVRRVKAGVSIYPDWRAFALNMDAAGQKALGAGEVSTCRSPHGSGNGWSPRSRTIIMMSMAGAA